MKNKTLDVHSGKWWLSIISLLAVFAQQVAHLFGWEITSEQMSELMALVNTGLVILGSLGLIYDTSDSEKTVSNIIQSDESLNKSIDWQPTAEQQNQDLKDKNAIEKKRGLIDGL